MLGVIPKPSWYYRGDASECERFTGRMAAAGDTKREKAENYSIERLMDNIVGAEQGFF